MPRPRARSAAFVLLVTVLGCSSSSRQPVGGGPTGVGGESAEQGPGGAGGSGANGETYAPGTWCGNEPAHAFCDDFDTPGFDPWTVAESGALGWPAGATRQTTTVTSPPNAISSSVPATSTGATRAQIRPSYAPAGQTSTSRSDITFAFEVELAAIGASPRVEIAAVTGFNIVDLRDYRVSILVAAGTPPELSLELNQADDGISLHPLTARLPMGEWTRITLGLGLTIGTGATGDPSTITVTVGASAPESFSMQRHMPLLPFFSLGVAASAPNEPATANFDNVAIDVR